MLQHSNTSNDSKIKNLNINYINTLIENNKNYWKKIPLTISQIVLIFIGDSIILFTKSYMFYFVIMVYFISFVLLSFLLLYLKRVNDRKNKEIINKENFYFVNLCKNIDEIRLLN
ncbi:hypothetical protein SLITO_v1c05720 [Spiroplasma litorale]|uniref:Uncharacterized protein n=1 Tax=Spiroplasma litorale TaxID=216942 RepID=A0A0K1W204_9MOLU|nr:hypothetical protein [Spiroplasma litorale]AKX34208.1 hypothetical protein SLITO_v1c05720 [Spiroplasma litorale]